MEHGQTSWHTSRFRLKPICIITQQGYAVLIHFIPVDKKHCPEAAMASMSWFHVIFGIFLRCESTFDCSGTACSSSGHGLLQVDKAMGQQQVTTTTTTWASPYYMMRCAGTQVRNAK